MRCRKRRRSRRLPSSSIAEAEGYASPVAQGGTNLSGGQKQRLAIARALVRNAGIYVFDDSFSALDFATDARLRAALRSRDVRRHGLHRVAAHRHGDERRSHHRARRWQGGGDRHSCGTRRDLRGLPRNCRLTGVARGGRMSDERMKLKTAGAAGWHLRPRADGRLRHARPEGEGLQGDAPPPERLPAPAPGRPDDRDRRRRHLHAVQRDRTEAAGQGDDEGLRGLPGARRRPRRASTSRTSGRC